MFTLSLIPVALTRTPQPPPPRLELMGPRDLYRVAPAAIVGCLASGLLSSAVIGLTPVYGTRLGLPVEFTVWLLTAIQLGSFVCQWPLGRLSDRVDRRAIIAGCAAAVSLLSPLIALAGADRFWLLPLFFLYGGTTLSFYAVAVAHAGDFADPTRWWASAAARSSPGRPAPPSAPRSPPRSSTSRGRAACSSTPS